jgi:hypothetical protein
VYRSIVIFVLFSSSPALAQENEPDECQTVEACIQRVYHVAEPPLSYGQYISPREQAVIERLVVLGDAAVPRLVELLADPNEDVAQIGAAALREVEQIPPVFLSQLLQGLDRGLPGLPEVFTNRLTEDPSVLSLRDLARAGPRGESAGPVVADLLNSPDWDVRIAAARALGFIEYQPAADSLVALLNDATDVRLNWIAAESLGRMRAATAKDALKETANNHWFPPVRQAALTALEHIEAGTNYVSRFPPAHFPLEFFSYEYMGEAVSVCDTVALAAKPEPADKKLYLPEARGQLEKLTYEVVDESAANAAERQTLMDQMPAFALRIAGGWLAGSDRGEWGGELVFIGDDGARAILLEKNIEDVHLLGERYVAVTGIANLIGNRGMLFGVDRRSNDQWSVAPWRSLPGAPISSWPVETGELLIDVAGGGSILIAADGTMRMAPCEDGE